MLQKKSPTMEASLPNDREWVQVTALEVVILQAKILG